MTDFARHLAELQLSQAQFMRVLSTLSGRPASQSLRVMINRWTTGNAEPGAPAIALCEALKMLPVSKVRLLASPNPKKGENDDKFSICLQSHVKQ